MQRLLVCIDMAIMLLMMLIALFWPGGVGLALGRVAREVLDFEGVVLRISCALGGVMGILIRVSVSISCSNVRCDDAKPCSIYSQQPSRAPSREGYSFHSGPLNPQTQNPKPYILQSGKLL